MVINTESTSTPKGLPKLYSEKNKKPLWVIVYYFYHPWLYQCVIEV